MPTFDDLVELYENTTHEWTTYQGRIGMKLTSKKNGHSIFLASDGEYEGRYLTSTLDDGDVIGIYCSNDSFGGTWLNIDSKHPVRAVIP